MRPTRMVPGGITHSWGSQAPQYTSRTDIIWTWGIVHWTVPASEVPVRIECLLDYAPDGELLGILNYYPDGSQFGEQPHDVLVLVNPRARRRGIGTALLKEAMRMWPDIDLLNQAYTPEGWALAQSVLNERSADGS